MMWPTRGKSLTHGHFDWIGLASATVPVITTGYDGGANDCPNFSAAPSKNSGQRGGKCTCVSGMSRRKQNQLGVLT